MTHDTIPETALLWHHQGRGAALATVVETWGSAPRQPGSQLAISGSGQIMGSVSGGCVEGAVVTEALEVLVDGIPRMLTFGVSDESAFAVGLACGGTIKVLVEPVAPMAEVLAELVAARAARRAVAYVVNLTDWTRALLPGGVDPAVDARLRSDKAGIDAVGTSGAGGDGTSTDKPGTAGAGAEGSGTDGAGTNGAGADGAGADGAGTVSACIARSGTDGSGADKPGTDGSGTDGAATNKPGADGVGTDGAGPAAVRFVAPHNPPLRLIVVGAVHIAQPLLVMARAVGYDPSLIDPRATFGAADRFPGEMILDDWPDEALAALAPDARTAIVTLTHDPKLDDPAIRYALRCPAFYLGCLGSKKTHAKRLERLQAAGFTDPEIARIHAPVGLNIGAKTPAEIAISILAQITQVLRGV